MSTDHRAEAEKWVRYADEESDSQAGQTDALVAIAHRLGEVCDVLGEVRDALLAEPKPPQISRAQWEAKSAFDSIREPRDSEAKP